MPDGPTAWVLVSNDYHLESHWVCGRYVLGNEGIEEQGSGSVNSDLLADVV